MTKAELVGEIASEGGITKSQAGKAVDGFVSAVSGALSGGDKITLVGFGTFSVGTRSQREGRNPRTGEKIEIPASKIIKFKAGKTLLVELASNHGGGKPPFTARTGPRFKASAGTHGGVKPPFKTHGTVKPPSTPSGTRGEVQGE